MNASDNNDLDSILCDIVISERHSTFDESDFGHRYIAPYEIRLETESGIVIGKMLGDLVNSGRIEADELYAVCDSDSAGLFAACQALFPYESEELHVDINPNHDHVGRFLFIHQWAFHPCVSPLNRMVLLHLMGDHILRYDDVIVAWETLADLEPSQLAELGYAKIAGTGLIFSHLSRLNEFTSRYDADDEEYQIIVSPPATAAQDFVNLWKEVSDR